MARVVAWETQPQPQSAAARLLANAVCDAVAICRGGQILWVNERMAEAAGRRRADELIGGVIEELIEASEGGASRAADVAGTGRAFECRLLRAEGEPRCVIARRVILGAGADECAWVFQDVIHVRNLEAEVLRMGRALHAANRELESLRERVGRESEEREELITVVSHELQTPVTVINGYNRLMLAQEVGPLNEEQRRFLEESTKSCRRLSAFIENLLEASRETRGDEALELRRASLAPTIESATELLRPLLDEQELRVDVWLDPQASEAHFDPQRIEQVLTNLIGNAIKHASSGGLIEISTRAATESKRPMLEVAVADDGPGVAEEDRERIFQPYVRASEESRAGGLGLGLAICRRLVAAHGGSIWVTEREDGGSRFAFTLPLSCGSPAEGA